MSLNKLAIPSFVLAGSFFGATIYKFTTTGVTMSPFMYMGIGSCLLSFGIICTFTKEEKKRRGKNGRNSKNRKSM